MFALPQNRESLHWARSKVRFLTNKIGTKPRILAGSWQESVIRSWQEFMPRFLSRILARILAKILGQNSCQESWPEFLPRILARILERYTSITTINLSRTTIEQLYCQECLVQILAKILGKNLSWQDLGKIPGQDFFFARCLAGSCQDCFLARSCQ